MISSFRKFNEYLQRSVITLIFAALLCVISVLALAEESTPVPEVASVESAPCKGLKPYNNLDELLYQFYVNLESDCLFTMPVEELEKVWSIKILDEESFKPKNYYSLAKTDFYFKPYKSEKDSFYIELVHSEKDKHGSLENIVVIFKIKPTKEYFKAQGALLPNNATPKLLPAPNAAFAANQPPPCHFPHIKKIERNTPICAYPAWRSSDHKRLISLNSSNEVRFEAKYTLSEKNLDKTSSTLSSDILDMATGDTGNVPCRGLGPVKDIEELLFQFYINFDSDCLFTMSMADLKKIWGINIYNYDESSSETYFYNKLNEKGNSPSFYVVISPSLEGDRTSSFTLKMAEEYERKNCTFFPNQIFPSFLPQPERRIRTLYPNPSNAYRDMESSPNNDIDYSSIFALDDDSWPDFEKEDDFTSAKSSVPQWIFGTPYYIVFNSSKTRRILFKERSIIIDHHVNF